MSLTGLQVGARASPAAVIAERVELLAFLWALLDGAAAYTANARLQMVARIVPELAGLPVTRQLADLRSSASRDTLIKGLASDAHGGAVSPEIAGFARALDALSGDWDTLLEGFAAPLTAAYVTMRARADALATGLAPAADVAAITGEPDAFGLVVLPSLFLPPPQNGRHSALIDHADGGATGYLHYGFPLDEDPAQFGINRYWLMGGAWHYPAHRFLVRHWPAMAADLRAMPALGAALVAALAEHRASVVWPEIVAEHLSIALKCELCARARLPETVHRSFARTQGLALFGWFREWIAGLANAPDGFVAAFGRLPDTMAAQSDALIAAAAETSSGPESINYALAAREHRPVIVLPDHWDAALQARIAGRWARITPTLLREAEWRRRPADATSVIAFGQVGRDSTVDDLLARRSLTLDRSAEGGEVLVSLFASTRARHPWQIAVAVHEPEVAGGFSAEHVMGLFHRTARFAGNRFVEGDGIA